MEESPEMTQHKAPWQAVGQRLRNPLLRVVSTWIWWALGALLTLVIIGIVLAGDPRGFMPLVNENRHLLVYVEFVSVGLLPVLYTFFCKDDLSRYGFQWRGLGRSMLFSAPFVIFMFALGYLMSGELMSDSRETLVVMRPWNYWYGAASIFVWGALEVFFVIWLIENTDDIFAGLGHRPFSWGLIITVVIFALTHLVSSGGWFNAFYTGFIFLILGLIFKYSRNIYGPMVAWTLINGQVWFMARLLFI